MSKAEKLESKIRNLSSFTEIVRKFVERLGDPSKYEYRGECIDLGRPTGRCTCDHPIRFVFIIHSPDGKTAPCGSECINHFSSYNPRLYTALTTAKEALFKRLAEEEKAKAEALRQAEKTKLQPDYDAAKTKFLSVCSNIRAKTMRPWLPYSMWKMETALTHEKAFKTTTGYVKYYRRTIPAIQDLLEKFERGELK